MDDNCLNWPPQDVPELATADQARRAIEMVKKFRREKGWRERGYMRSGLVNHEEVAIEVTLAILYDIRDRLTSPSAPEPRPSSDCP